MCPVSLSTVYAPRAKTWAALPCLETAEMLVLVGVRVDDYGTIMKTIMGTIMRTIIVGIIVIDHNRISDSRGAYTIMAAIMILAPIDSYII